MSLEINHTDYHSYDTNTDFDAAAYFTQMVARKMLAASLPEDVDLLKLEVPAHATRETKIVIARQDKLCYYMPSIEKREDLSTPAKFTHMPSKGEYTRTDTDAYALAQGLVCITPLSLDLTSRVLMSDLADLLDTPSI